MLTSLNDNMEAIATLCRTHGVKVLYAFGSVLTSEFDSARSDIDFAVEFKSLTPSQRARAYFALLQGLEEMFGRNVDLVSYGAIENPYFRKSVDETKVSVYAAA